MLVLMYQLASKFDEQVIAEEFIAGQELTASLLGDHALPLVRIEAPEGKYDYENKYFTDVVKYHCPAGVRPDLEDEIRAMALKAFRVLGCRGWGRADVMLREDGAYSFLEMNTSPGMTGHSLVPIAAKAAGMSLTPTCACASSKGARLDSGVGAHEGRRPRCCARACCPRSPPRAWPPRSPPAAGTATAELAARPIAHRHRFFAGDLAARHRVRRSSTLFARGLAGASPRAASSLAAVRESAAPHSVGARRGRCGRRLPRSASR